MQLSQWRKVSPGGQIGMAGFSLGILCMIFIAVSCTQTGLAWWLELGWPVQAGRGLLWLMVLPLGLLLGSTVYMVSNSAGLGVLVGLVVEVLLGLIFSFIAPMVANTHAAHAGLYSVYRASIVEEAVDAHLHALENLDTNLPAKPDKKTLAAVDYMQAALQAPTHRNLQQAYPLAVSGFAGRRMQRALDAALLLGLSARQSVQNSRFRGRMDEQDLADLQRAARRLAINEGRASKWTPLQQSAFLALTQDEGLSFPLSVSKESSR